MNLHWEAIDDRDDLARVEALLGELEAVLVAERAAVAELEAAAIERAAAEKERIARDLVDLAASAEPDSEVTVRADDPAMKALRQRVRERAQRARASAQANAALLRDAIDAVAGALGLGGDAATATYDRHARTRAATRHLAGKAA